jgi:transcriptional regulator with GAF, ATPase, and Fis domain
MALDWLASYSRDRHLETSITTMGRRVREISPQCFALSLGLLEEGLTFTLVSESREAAMLDAIQYVDGGPCVDATVSDEAAQATHLPTDEDLWQLFSKAQSVAGVASTLSLPIMRGDQVVCGVNLYASETDAFDGHHDELADACGAWAEGVVTNADLTFTSRLRAAAAPTRLRDNQFFDAATGYVAAHQDIGTEAAAAKIRDAAVRAGVSPADVARFLVNSNPELGV